MTDIKAHMDYWTKEPRNYGDDVTAVAVLHEARQLKQETDYRFLYQKDVINDTRKYVVGAITAIDMLTIALGIHLLWHIVAKVVEWWRYER